MRKRPVLIAIIAAVVLFGLIQLVPYGHTHTNPPVAQEPNWDSQATRDLAKRACFDCHSNETTWPWYSNIAPVSWLLARDVNEGRDRMNLSQWSTRANRNLDEIVRNIERGEMPPFFYTPLHPTAKLTADEKAQLIAGFQKTLK